jgi:hypothetical protein
VFLCRNNNKEEVRMDDDLFWSGDDLVMDNFIHENRSTHRSQPTGTLHRRKHNTTHSSKLPPSSSPNYDILTLHAVEHYSQTTFTVV